MNSFNQFFVIFFLTFVLVGCIQESQPKVEKRTDSPKNTEQTENTIKLHQLKKEMVAGDFDGDGARDTIFQHNFSGIEGNEIEFAADPFQNNWDTVINWFYDQKSNVYLAMNKINADTLHLGPAQGLYCLINVGDNNSDGKDEIAIVVDHLDFSNVNICRIYSLCKGKWAELQQFEIHEESFSYTSDEAPVFHEIKDFLEKQNGIWVYKDYSIHDYDKEEEVGKMLKLKPNKCK